MLSAFPLFHNNNLDSVYNYFLTYKFKWQIRRGAPRPVATIANPKVDQRAPLHQVRRLEETRRRLRRPVEVKAKARARERRTRMRVILESLPVEPKSSIQPSRVGRGRIQSQRKVVQTSSCGDLLARTTLWNTDSTML